ncbi:MAG TPA: tetratricopeptide repeat protein [Blastocatellia bacterium]|nr:tetratricopeptide repeat protein [Blastocatellia bacterium]
MAIRLGLRVALLTVGVLVITGSAFSQAVHSLQGRVAFPNGSSPPNPVRVKLTFNGMNIYETFTDLSGRFSFTALRNGTYALTAEGDGETFETTTVSADVAAFGTAAQVFTQNIQLRLKAGKAIPPASTVEAYDPNIPARSREEYERGVKDAGNNKPENAVKHLREALTIYPQFYSAHVAIAEQYSKLNRDEEAAAAYQRAIELKPEHAQAYVGLGMMLVKQKRYLDAIAPLRRSLEIEKQSSTPYLFLGLAEMMTGDYGASESNLLRAYEIGKPGLAHIYLANLYELKHEPSKAIDHLKAFLKENPNLPEERQIQLREAIEKLRKQSAVRK